MSEAAFKDRQNPDIPRPVIFAYQDYKIFLRDYFHYLKVADPEFSHRNLAAKADIAVGYLSTILNSNKDISMAAVEKIAPHLGFSRTEMSYFKILCTILESSSSDERAEAVKKLRRFEQFNKLSPDESLYSQYMSKWHYVAIREMANKPGFQTNVAWIQEQLNFTVHKNEIAKALEFLLQNKLIRIKSDGQFAASEDRVICEGKIFRFTLTHFLKQIYELGLQAIDNTKREFRNSKGHTICLSKERFQTAKAIMDEAIEKIAALEGEKSPSKSVYHFSFLAFPMSKVDEEK